MHFTNLLTAALLVATGVSALGSPRHVYNPSNIGRRHSRKAIANEEKRHWHHHHHSGTGGPAPTDGSVNGTDPSPTSTDDCSGDDTPVTVTVYTTVTPGAPAPTDGTPTNGTNPDDGTPTSSGAAPTGTGSDGTNQPSNSGAVIQATSPQCGDPNAVATPQPTSGPNGDENWLNCGVDGSGWNPPPVTLTNLIYRDLADVLQESGNPFDACSDYMSMFQDMETSTGIPAIFLASIALQESGCNPTVTGGAGEIGMMQITSEKCPTDGSDCYDAATNISIGASYFKDVIDNQCGGNVACAMGAYNGWYQGLTVAGADNYSTCAQHNNLDYLQNVFNGYLQGVDPASLNMGIYHNTC